MKDTAAHCFELSDASKRPEATSAYQYLHTPTDKSPRGTLNLRSLVRISSGCLTEVPPRRPLAGQYPLEFRDSAAVLMERQLGVQISVIACYFPPAVRGADESRNLGGEARSTSSSRSLRELARLVLSSWLNGQLALHPL